MPSTSEPRATFVSHASSRIGSSSARNQMRGIVTRVVSDRVMSQVDVQAGPFRLVSLLSTEAVQELGLEPGSVVVASVKATHVTIGAPSLEDVFIALTGRALR